MKARIETWNCTISNWSHIPIRPLDGAFLGAPNARSKWPVGQQHETKALLSGPLVASFTLSNATYIRLTRCLFVANQICPKIVLETGKLVAFSLLVPSIPISKARRSLDRALRSTCKGFNCCQRLCVSEAFFALWCSTNWFNCNDESQQQQSTGDRFARLSYLCKSTDFKKRREKNNCYFPQFHAVAGFAREKEKLN